MKKLTFWKSLFLLFALIVGTSTSWAATYKLTSVTSVSAGNKYVFVRDGHALSNSVNSSSALQTVSSYSTTGLSGTEAYVWTLETATNGFYLKNASLSSSQYLNNGSKTNMAFGNASSDWTIEFTNGVALISNTSNSNRFLGDAGKNSPNHTYKAYATSNLSDYQHDFTVYILEEEAISSVETPQFFPAGGTYTSTQSVTLSCETTGADIYYTLDGTTPTASSTKYNNTAISISETKTIKAIAIKGSDESNVATATYTIYPVLHAGTASDPYTVADARNAIEANIGVTGVYVSGIVCEGGSELSSGAMNYWISDDGTETNKFEIYKGKGINGASFSAVGDVQVGDVVVVKGDIKKFGTTYEFNTGSQLVSLDRPVVPLITVTPASLTGFTYGVGFGPSTTKTFTVEGSNLTANISLSLGESSNFEMSTTEGSGYTNSLTLTQTSGAVASTTIYVRLKAGLDVNASYSGNIALTSTGATAKAVSLSGSVTTPNFTWDLSTNSYSDASEEQVTWPSTFATMVVDKAESTTAANNYLGGDSNNRTSSRFYKNSYLTITPTSGYSISSVVFTAASSTYATALESSTWSNATAAVSSTSNTTVTVTPTNGALPISAKIGATCGFTAVKVYYAAATTVTLTPAKTYTTLTSSHNLDFTSVSDDLKAFIAIEVDGDKVKMTQVNKVPANTGLVLKATTPNSAVNVPVFDGTGAEDVTGNKMVGSATETTAIEKDGGYILSDGIFQPANAGTLAAGKAYLQIAVTSARSLEMSFDDATTGIANLNVDDNFDTNAPMYNLAGQRVNKSYKGVVIVNGKKMLNK